MRISEVRIQNYRSIADSGNLACDRLMVFIGRNNAGKSNILRALDTLFNASKPQSADIPSFAADGDFITLSATFIDISIPLKQRLHISEDTLTIEKTFPITITPMEKKVGSAYETLNGNPLGDYRKNGSFSGLAELRNFLHSHLPKYYYVPALRNLADEGKFKRGTLIQDLLLPLLNDNLADDNQNILGHLNAIQSILQTRCHSLETEISSILRNRVDDFDSLTFDISEINLKKALSPHVVVTIPPNNEKMSALMQGAGTQNFIILALAQYYARGTAPVDLIIAFEEPEISLHSAAQRNMLDLLFQILKNDRQQIFLTTHSTIFIDRTSDAVCLVRKDTGGKTTLTIPKRTKEIINQLGIRGSDYFASDALIFVEGVSDYEVFSLFAQAHAPESWQKFVFTFVPLGGLPSIENFRIEDYRALNSYVYAILDSDKAAANSTYNPRAREIVQKITLDLGGLVKILQRRELENYFTYEAVKEVFSGAKSIMDPHVFSNPYASLKEHLNILVQEDFYEKHRHRPNYDSTITQTKRYSSYHARLIGEKMVEHDTIPQEIIDIFNDIGKHLSLKIPKY